MEKAKRGLELLEIDLSDVEGVLDTHLPDPVQLEFYRRLAKREILWNEDIDTSTIDVSMYIRKWNGEDVGIPADQRNPIKIFINSDGGCVNTVLNVIDTISLSKTPVITIGMGKVYSSGGMLLMAGHKRYVFEHTSCLIHDGSSGAIGDIGKLIVNLKFTEQLEERVRKYIVSRTKITEEMYDSNYRRDWFMFSDEMIKYGIADKIITDIDEIL